MDSSAPAAASSELSGVDAVEGTDAVEALGIIEGLDIIGNFVARFSSDVLEILLHDHATNRHIIWADSEYEHLGDGYRATDEIELGTITGAHAGVIMPRIAKEPRRRTRRTRTRAEVFTPSWLCNFMNNRVDEVWFGRSDVFNQEQSRTWVPTSAPVAFLRADVTRSWRAYVASPRLEITCGEAPFLCSRYDTVTGASLPVPQRIGILDRKLRVVSEHATTRDAWMRGAELALQSTYGFECQGDNLLIARINVFETVADHLRYRWGEGQVGVLAPDECALIPSECALTPDECAHIADIIAWNLWQMDGKTGCVPLGNQPCVLRCWSSDQVVAVNTLGASNGEGASALASFGPRACTLRVSDVSGASATAPEALDTSDTLGASDKPFFAIVGNPPYQDRSVGDNVTYEPPVYHRFLEAAYALSDLVVMVHPARFLFNAGSTPKAWNRKMLSDEHLRVLWYETHSDAVFAGTDIKGGVAVTMRDGSREFGPIGVFTPYPQLTSIVSKVTSAAGFAPLSDIAVTRTAYRLTELLHADHPEAAGQLSQGHAFDMATNIFERLPQVFYAERPSDGREYIQVIGREHGRRVVRFIRRDYVNHVVNLDAYKVLVPKANGTGAFGEAISAPFVAGPGVGSTETFMSIGTFATREQAEVCLRYICTKFARALLGVLKTTQDLTPMKWGYVPRQDFTTASGIDWNQAVADIDRQLDRKYGLDAAEVAFIEANVTAM